MFSSHASPMRGCLWSFLPVLSLLLPLCGCGLDPAAPYVIGTAASLATVPVLGRTLPDVAVSLVRNQDCSMVRVEQGKSYCRTPDPPLDPPTGVVCTRSLADVDCYINPQMLVGQVKSVADGPGALTAEQEAYRTRGWLW
jgi:hypothetical protein